MKLYINSVGIISPSLQASGEWQLPRVDENYLTCIEPDYTQWIQPQQLRRMSRIMKMGTTAALMAVKAGESKSDAIIAGTAYGCLEDTATFLTKIIELNEEALNPTPFMQSTHNTIAAQIALLQNCQGYNQTYVHGAFSFEHALLDAGMLLTDNPAQTILTGGVDELTKAGHAIHSRFNKYRKENTPYLISPAGDGTWAGEGAAFFMLSGADESTVAIADVHTFMASSSEQAFQQLDNFLKQNQLDTNTIDFLLTGKNGDQKNDLFYDQLIDARFSDQAVGAYKHLCGEYSTSTAFATALAYTILKHQTVPVSVLNSSLNTPIKTLLIYNTYGQHHSLILLTV